MISKQLVIKVFTCWTSFCKRVLLNASILKNKKICEVGKVVEIDEGKFGKENTIYSHYAERQWVLFSS